MTGGSTALVAIRTQKYIYIINCGDSSAVMVNSHVDNVKLNSEHRLNNENELQRVVSNGGIILDVKN